jgi:intracellular sulfur oxidation DsrE/DsrF family protein
MMTLENSVILITSNGMGRGPEDLQLTLVGKYLSLLLQNGSLPAVICFYTDGVKLVVENSPVLEQLHALEKAGVRLVVCSTCLNFYHLTEKVKAGIVGSMADILEAQVRAEKVITL